LRRRFERVRAGRAFRGIGPMLAAPVRRRLPGLMNPDCSR